MPSLLDYTSYADAQAHYSPEAAAALFDGGRDGLPAFNIAHECVDRHAARTNMAVRVLQDDGNTEEIGFAALAELSSRCARWMQRQGVASGDRVGIMLEPGIALAACVFGALKIGAVVVPLFPLFGAQALEERLELATPRLLFTSPELATAVRVSAGRFGAQTVVIDAAFLGGLEPLGSPLETGTRPDDQAVHLFTSGTTRARPSAVRFTHNALRLLVPAALYGAGLRPGDKLFCPSSPAWGHGFWFGLIAPLGFGITVCSSTGRFKPERMLEAMHRFDIDTVTAAPTVFRMLRNSGLPWRGAPLRKISFSGEGIDGVTADWIRATFGTPPCSIYGTTEVGVVLGQYPGAADHVVKAGSLGKPFPGQRLEVQDAEGRRAAPHVVGEIKVWRSGRWLPTRDLGYVDEDGCFFHGGRADDVIISAGWTLSAIEIEETLRQHPAVKDVAVIGVADAVRGQVVKAFVVSREAGTEQHAVDLQQFARERLGAHEYPRLVEFVQELPTTPAGKIHRKTLREREAAKAARPMEAQP